MTTPAPSYRAHQKSFNDRKLSELRARIEREGRALRVRKDEAGPELSRKADLAIADLNSNGGLLLPEQNMTFIRKLMDAPTVLSTMRVVPMSSPTQYINKIGLGSRILRVANQGTSPFLNDSNVNSRWLAAADRSKVVSSQISMTTKEIMAEVHVPYEVFEDNIERGGLENTIMELVAERTALDLEELVITGDTANGGDSYLALHDGILKRVATHVVDNLDAGINVTMFNSLKKAIPTAYRRNLASMNYYVSMDVESDYRVQVASRGTGLGDSVLLGGTKLPVLGIDMIPAALMPNDKAILTSGQNLLFGVQRNIRVETDKDIRAREIIIVLTMRVAMQVEELDAAAKLVNIQP